MKNLLVLLAMVLMNVNAEASSQVAPDHYEVQFELTSFGPICPRPTPGRVSCMAIGNVARLAAPLRGCLDRVVYSDFKQVRRGKSLTIYATGVAKVDPKSASARCFAQNVHTAVVSIPRDVTDVQVMSGNLSY